MGKITYHAPQSNILYLPSHDRTSPNAHETQGSYRDVVKQGLQGCETKGLEDDPSKSSQGAVGDTPGKSVGEDEIRLGVSESINDLRTADCFFPGLVCTGVVG